MDIINIFALLLAIVAASPRAYSNRELSWSRGVFPDDEHWPSPYRRKHLASVHVETKQENDKVCETAGCKIVAEEFLSSMNESVNPCEDFYEFTCGGWSAKNVIPPDSPVWSRFMIFDNTAKHRIKGVLESAPEPSDILPVRQAKKWYRSCMDTENLERRGLTPIESILMQVGGWPITVDEEEWDSEEYTWQRVERDYARLIGTDAFFRIQVFPGRGSGSGAILHMAPQLITLYEQLPMSYRNYSGNDYDAYVKLVESVAELFVQHNHANVPKDKLAKEAREIVEFEKQLHELVSERFSYDEIVFKDLEDWYDNITEFNTDPEAKVNLTSLLEGLFETANIKLDPDTNMICSGVPYVKGLGQLLKRTPDRTIVNYIHWTFVGNMLVYTTETVRNDLLAFVWEQYGVKQRRPRWAECVDEMKMTHAAAYVFVEKYFTKTTENAATEMIENIRKEMEEKIEKSAWLDAESKTIAKEKLNRMRIFLGFPDWYKNKTAVVNYYKGITIGAEFFDNTLGYMRYERKNDLKRYLPGAAEETWFMDPITVNALYSPEDNLLNLPAVDFQAPLFTRQLPDAVNYGVAGVIVGHEMGHGFDDSGIQYGIDGNRTELSEKILKSYYQLADCFTDQFEEYYREAGAPDSEGTTPKGQRSAADLAKLTRGENIADTTGIQAVFKAYRKMKKQSGTSRLPGLEKYTEDQLFFVSFAAVWCKVETPQYEEKRKERGDEHSPAKLRVLGSISNTEDFARAFKCRKDSAMNPNNKCDIWKKSDAESDAKKSSLRRKDLPWKTQWRH